MNYLKEAEDLLEARVGRLDKDQYLHKDAHPIIELLLLASIAESLKIIAASGDDDNAPLSVVATQVTEITTQITTVNTKLAEINVAIGNIDLGL